MTNKRDLADWAELAAFASLAKRPMQYGIMQPVMFVVVAACLTREVHDLVTAKAFAIRLRYAYTRKFARFRETIRALKDQVRRLQTGHEIESDYVTDNEAIMLAERDRMRAELDWWKRQAKDLAFLPVLKLDPEKPEEFAWVSLGVHAGIISTGKARELLGDLDIDTWRRMSPLSEDAMARIVEAINADD